MSPKNSRKLINLDEENINELKEAFDMFDTDSSGKVETKELRRIADILKYDSHLSYLKLLQGIEERGKTITFETFLLHIDEKLGNRNSIEGIRRIFELFDTDGSGTIDMDKIKKVSREIGEDFTDPDIQAALVRASSDSKSMNFDDFYTVMTRKFYA